MENNKVNNKKLRNLVMCSNWRLANTVNIILYLSISQKGYVNASLGSIIKFQHEHIWVIFQLIQGLTGFIEK